MLSAAEDPGNDGNVGGRTSGNPPRFAGHRGRMPVLEHDLQLPLGFPKSVWALGPFSLLVLMFQIEQFLSLFRSWETDGLALSSPGEAPAWTILERWVEHGLATPTLRSKHLA